MTLRPSRTISVTAPGGICKQTVFKAHRESRLVQVVRYLRRDHRRAIQPQIRPVLQGQRRNHLCAVLPAPFRQTLSRLLAGRQMRVASSRRRHLGDPALGPSPAVEARLGLRHLRSPLSKCGGRPSSFRPAAQLFGIRQSCLVRHRHSNLPFGLIREAVIGFFGVIQLFAPLDFWRAVVPQPLLLAPASPPRRPDAKTPPSSHGSFLTRPRLSAFTNSGWTH